MKYFFMIVFYLFMITFFFNPVQLLAVQINSVSLCEKVDPSGTVPLNITDKFSTSIPEIHAIAVLSDVPAGTRIKGAWISIDAIDVPNYQIDAAEVVFTRKEGTAHFSLSRPTNGWPTGNYKLDISVNGRLITSAGFSITTGPTAPSGTSLPAQSARNITPAVSASPTAGGGGFTGSYQMNTQGATISLQLQQDRQGKITGSLTSTTGMQYQLEGQLQEESAVGICYDNQGGVYFEAFFEGDQLLLGLIEPDANNMPDYSRARQLIFTRASGTSAENWRPSGSAAPQARPQTPPGYSASGSDLLGNWQCQTSQGPLTLIFQSSSQLSFAGDLTSYSLIPGAIRVQTEYGPMDYPYQLQGNTLSITFPEGNQLQFTRTGSAGAPSGTPVGQPSGSGQEYLLQGTLCRWSGSSSSYSGTSSSSSTRVHFDGQGNFSYSTESSFSGDAGMAYGANQNPANRGTYRVVGNQVHLTFGDGSSGVATVQMQQNDGRITELMYDGQLYAKGLCE